MRALKRGCWVELEDKDVHCKEWKCIIENFAEKEADTTVHQIYGQRATLSVNYKPGDWNSVRAWILKAGSGWHQAETAEDPKNMNNLIPAKKWGDTEIAERGRSVPVMRARYRSTGLNPHQRGWTDAG